ncbi:MAG: SMC-Scp complex subunit ScpB [Chloroflexi bacterium]|nr:MAG: SMC-Scp complex subunit ScpB [Chloroflexota bacterium]
MTDRPIPQNGLGIPLPAGLEALLFAAPGPVTPGQLAAALEVSLQDVEAGLTQLEETYQGRGIRLQRHAGKIQLTTAPEAAAQVEKLIGLEAASRLSRAALETLAIVAYQQPVTRPEIDAIRGVNSDGVLKSLLSKGLVQETGRAERPGRPILYATTSDFLSHFGLASLNELPPLATINQVPEQAEEKPDNGDYLKG